MHREIVETERGRRVDRVRLGDRGSVRNARVHLLAHPAHGPAYATEPAPKKGRRKGALFRWEVLLGKF